MATILRHEIPSLGENFREKGKALTVAPGFTAAGVTIAAQAVPLAFKLMTGYAGNVYFPAYYLAAGNTTSNTAISIAMLKKAKELYVSGYKAAFRAALWSSAGYAFNAAVSLIPAIERIATGNPLPLTHWTVLLPIGASILFSNKKKFDSRILELDGKLYDGKIDPTETYEYLGYLYKRLAKAITYVEEARLEKRIALAEAKRNKFEQEFRQV